MTRPTECPAPDCGMPIFWMRVPSGEYIAVDPDGTPHQMTCPVEEQLR